MIITLFGVSGERLLIQPDPAIVHVGDRVAWELYFDFRERDFGYSLLWTIYFGKGHPFRFSNGGRWSIRSEPNQRVIVDVGRAEESGDYKYGVLITNAETGGELSDDDPRLIVVT